MAIKLLVMTTVNPDEPLSLENYLRVVGPLVEAAGGRLIDRFEVAKTIVGQGSAQFITLVEYPDEEAIHSVFQSDEYKALEETRNKAFSSYQVNILS